MEDFFIKLLTTLYGFVGIIGTLGHLPIIKDLYIKKELNFNLNSYLIWTFTSIVMMLYGFFIIQDTLFLIVTGLGTLFCMIVLFLGFSIKRANSRSFIKNNKSDSKLIS
ncbi:hypothetical protein CSB08_00445 [Candidatus Gracilibacteria bacterium]|nr:MAG: hypothetical protein CSB08_00445 [Candidatus Gracilibacteria bacterium]PIE85311.1 MAG: hypothetical protein CSA08_02795 [Candidatus Gracilibacteria bacterium]